ncbi:MULTISPECIES: AfsR/SARP family transcriptional regulator [unclassified Streptomyces]|uniref:AfsR/SARP family transcriptional regulator n=1 Tax=unclassified Streptomyces TaxID=2593676 RepID=UPI0033265FAF
MSIRLLGELDANLNEQSVTPTAAKPRQVLALLALNAGRIVSVPTLIEELWGDHPPMSVRTTLQTYILQLRKLIDSALTAENRGRAKGILVTRFDGYLLDIDPESVDVRVYERFVEAGNRAIENSDDEAVSKYLGRALAEWRGRALADVRIGMPLSIEVARLEESRLNVLESRIGADIRLGRHHAVLSELTVLTAQHPMHENLCAHYMVSLYRAGRQSQALQSFRTLRDTLNRELGVEPSIRLQKLQRAVLRSALDLEVQLRPDSPSLNAGAWDTRHIGRPADESDARRLLATTNGGAAWQR